MSPNAWQFARLTIHACLIRRCRVTRLLEGHDGCHYDTRSETRADDAPPSRGAGHDFPLLRPGGRLSLVANLFASCRPIFWQRARGRERSSYSCRPEAAVLGVKDQFRRWTHKGLTRLPRYQSSHVRPSLNRRYSCPRPSSVGHPREGVLTEPCLGRTVSSRLSIITGRQGYPITSMKVQKYTCAAGWRSDPIT